MNSQRVIDQLQAWADELFAKSLALDPISAKRMRKYAGHSIEVECSQPDITWHANISEYGIEVRLGPAPAPNVHLKGSAVELLKRTLATNSGAAVEVNGDETLLLELLSVLSDFRPDLAPVLAKLLGHDRAQSLSAILELGAGSAIQFARSQLQEVQRASRHSINRNFTGRTDMDTLQNQLDQLRLQIDRVAARLEQLEQSATGGV